MKILISKIVLTISLFCCATLGFSQEKERIEFANTITKADLSKHLHIIASDEYEGRMTGSKGQKKAAKYIAQHFKKVQLKTPFSDSETPYFQKFSVWRKAWGEVSITLKSSKKEGFKDFFPYQEYNIPKTTTDLIFIGFGKETDYKGIDVKGKAVLIIQKKKDISPTEAADIARDKGAKLIIIALSSEKDYKEKLAYKLTKKKKLARLKFSKKEDLINDFGILYTYPKVAAELLGTSLKSYQKALKKQQKKQLAGQFQNKITTTLEWKSTAVPTENVLGYIEGTDKKEEILVLTAHYDHIGITDGKINNGADDDGSGTVAILELAEAFSKAKAAGFAPRRTILFMTVTGEEVGLFGSKYYSQNPYFPLAKTVTNLNMDMIGRIDKEHKGNPNYIYIIGSDMLSKELHQINEDITKKYIPQMQLDYKYNSADDPNRFYYRSDHYNFAKNGIPVIFYFNGTHKDYHQPTDTVDKIHFGKIETITRLMFHVAWEIANRDEKPKLDEEKK